MKNREYSTWHKVKVNLPNRYNQIIHLVQCDQKRYNAHSPINKRTNTYSHLFCTCKITLREVAQSRNYCDFISRDCHEKYECDVGERETVSVGMSLFKKKKRSIKAESESFRLQEGKMKIAAKFPIDISNRRKQSLLLLCKKKGGNAQTFNKKD
uniref:Uncharacterized protein n=1 Tax=Glossina austeni TaxID=7395 RepID=A0A1A9VTN8_GLOAU